MSTPMTGEEVTARARERGRRVSVAGQAIIDREHRGKLAKGKSREAQHDPESAENDSPDGGRSTDPSDRDPPSAQR